MSEKTRTKIESEGDALEAWIREVTDILVYDRDIPWDHKESLVNAFAKYRKAIGRPLREEKP